jgi:hypothetical protein
MNRPMRLPLAALLAALLVWTAAAFVGAREARAEDPVTDEPSAEDLAKKLKEQIEKILALMRENEKALLVASTGNAATPTKPEVTIPPGEARPPEAGRPPEGGTPEEKPGEKGDPREKGEEIARRMREMIKQQGDSAGRIPREIGELIRMIPPQQGSGGDPKGQKDPKEGGQMPESQEAREAKRLQEEREEMRRREEERQRQQAQKEPGDPRNRGDVPPEDEAGAGRPKEPDIPAWVTGLPKEIRDAVSGGAVDRVPARWRAMVSRYLIWLAQQPGRGER